MIGERRAGRARPRSPEANATLPPPAPAGAPPPDVVVDRFNRAWRAHDLEAALALLAEDCVFENTWPAPDGERFAGVEAIAAAWAPLFADPRTRIDTEETFVAGERLVQRWRYSWGDGSVRGIDVIVVRGGRIAAKLSYVKG